VCCDEKMSRVFSAVNFCRFRSGDRKKPLIGPDGFELDPKKQDIFGRKLSELPDDLAKTHFYWRKIDEFEETYRRPAPEEYKQHLIKQLFGKEVEEKVKEVKDESVREVAK